MKVLLISLFHPELVRGGAQQVCYELFEGLKATPGIEPVLLAAIDQSHPAFYKAGACITGFDGRPGEFLFLSRQYDYWWHKTSAERILEAYAEFLLQTRPAVVHFHHFLLLGLDLLTLTRRTLPDARIVFTLHEFMSICAADGQMLRVHDKSLCERASPARCSQCFPDRSPEVFFLREMWVKKHFSAVDVFTTPSRFMMTRFIEWGIDAERLLHVTNGQRNYNAAPKMSRPRACRNRFGFFGQLVDNKGVWVILEAVAQLRSERLNDFVVEINGDNLRFAGETRRLEFEAFRKEEEKRPYAERNVVFNGAYQVDQLQARMTRVDWCIVPSVWWETFGLVISEAWMFGRPVIASGIGAMAERVRHEVDGLTFTIGSGRALADTMRRCMTEEGLWETLSAGIRQPPDRQEMVEGMLACYESSVQAARPLTELV